MMDYLRAKFGDFSFSRFDYIVRTDRRTDRITEADQRYSHATTINMSINDNSILTLVVIKEAARKKMDRVENNE